MSRLLALLTAVVCLAAPVERLRRLWQVNLGPLPPAGVFVSVSVCPDGSVLAAEAGMPLIRVDVSGTVRSTDWVIGDSRAVCVSDGFAELRNRTVELHQWNGRRSEIELPVRAFNAVELPNRDMLLTTEGGPMLLSRSDLQARAIDGWGAKTPDLRDAFLAVHDRTLAVVYPNRIVFHDSVTFRPLNVSVVPISRTDRELYFGAGFLSDGRLAAQTRSGLLLIDPYRSTQVEVPLTRRTSGLLHGSGSDGCLVFSAFHPDTGKVLRKSCIS